MGGVSENRRKSLTANAYTYEEYDFVSMQQSAHSHRKQQNLRPLSTVGVQLRCFLEFGAVLDGTKTAHTVEREGEA